MKKIVGLILIGIWMISPAWAQDQSPTDNNSDDVYYSGDETPPADQSNQQVDENGNPIDGTAPTYQEFYDQLSPYGSWINYPGYGYVWVPNQGQIPPDFSPYMTGGYWAMTDYGWTWVSDYAWGWGPFHYGRWFDDITYGWLWIPGYDWAPAWCVWGDYGGYYCWAPIGPGAYISPHYRPDARYWHFIDHGHMGDRNMGQYVARNEDVMRANHITNINDINSHVNIISHANTYNQSVFFAGPKAAEVQKYTGRPVTPVKINDVKSATATKAEGGQLNIYRPSIQRTTRQPAPAKVSKPEEVHPAATQQPARQNTAPQKEQQAQPQKQVEPQKQSWTPPRQSTPQQQAPARQADHSFVPSERPSYSAPARSAPMGGGSFGGGARGGGGGRR